MSQLNYLLTIPNVSIANIGNAGQPQIAGYTHTNGGFENVIVVGDYAYVSCSGGDSTGILGLSLVVYNVSDPTAPFWTGYLTTGSVPWASGAPYANGCYSVAVNNNYLYYASTGSSYLYVIDISDPTNPHNISRLLVANTPGSLYGISYLNNRCYIATQNKGLTVVDVTDPMNPLQVFQEGGTLNKSIGVCVATGYCYTTNYQTTSPWTVRYLKTWSLTAPATPVLLSTYTLPAGSKPYTVTVNGNTAFVADDNTSTIQIVDITNPAAPNYLSSLHASGTFNVSNNVSVVTGIDATYAFLASGSNVPSGGVIDFFDISNLSTPVLKSTYRQGVTGSVFGPIYLSNNILYVSDYYTSPAYNCALRTYSTPIYIAPAIPSAILSAVSVQATGLGGSAGTYRLQGSNDTTPESWNDIPGTAARVHGIGTSLVPNTGVCYQNIRCVYTNTGTSGVSLTLKALGT